MPIFEKDGERILFIHIPKTGGSTIEAHFMECGYNVSYLRGLEFGQLLAFDRANGCTPQHMHAELINKHIGNQNFDLEFTIIRDPIKRFISEFSFRKDLNHRFAQGDINDFCSTMLDGHSKNPSFFDNHIRPQFEFIRNQTKVFRLEYGMEDIIRNVSLPLRGFSPSEIKIERSSKKNNSTMSDQTLDRLRNFYEKDFYL